MTDVARFDNRGVHPKRDVVTFRIVDLKLRKQVNVWRANHTYKATQGGDQAVGLLPAR